MRFFSKKDSKAVGAIFLVLIGLIAINLRVSIRKGRDNIRKTDVTSIQRALEQYLVKYQVFPESSNGKIVGCMGADSYFDEKTGRYMNLRECEWGLDSFENLERLPQDPQYEKGRSYLYLSNIKRFQLFTSLEGKGEAEYTESVARRGLNCGNAICNFGKSYGGVSLFMSLEDYEKSGNK